MSVGLQRLRDEPDLLRRATADKGEDPGVVERALELDGRRRDLLAEGDALKAERNEASRKVGDAVRAGADPNGDEVAELKAASTRVAERIATIDTELVTVQAELDDAMLRIPNPADPDVPVGGEEANVTVRTWGEPLPREDRRPHWEIAEQLGLIDNARGAKITGSGFPVYLGAGSNLQRALISWFLDVHTRENGMTEVWPPVLVNADSARGHRADPGQGRPDVRRHPRRPLPHPDRRGAGHQPPPRRDPGRARRSPSATPRTRRRSVAKRVPPAVTRAGSCGFISSTRSRW